MAPKSVLAKELARLISLHASHRKRVLAIDAEIRRVLAKSKARTNPPRRKQVRTVRRAAAAHTASTGRRT